MRTVLAALRAMILELRHAPQDWKQIITATYTIINCARLEDLGTSKDAALQSPLQVMIGLLPSQPVSRIIP